ncbi:MAG TPA: CDP-alcohol phosphatidyltransferase family protein [Rhodothermales bacterium]|nr:CDP-alcohol phosphatidyltransferase family protein [Rhodothermales bacterium]
MKHLPNALTIARIAVTPLCLWGLLSGTFVGQLVGTTLFILAAISDYWDGRLARDLDVRSRLGQFLDPLADKVLVLGAFVVIVMVAPIDRGLAAPAGAWVPWFFVGLIAVRDLAVTALRSYFERQNRPLRTLSAAKWKTAWQLTCLIALQLCLVLGHARVLDGAWGSVGRFFYRLMEGPFPLIFIGVTALVTVYTGALYFTRREEAEAI